MISREEKNKKLDDIIKHEKTINSSKKVGKFLFLVILIFMGLFMYAYFLGIKGFKTNEYVIKDNIPDSFDGIKILHFSDLLYGKTIIDDSLNDLLEEFKLINPDIVVFTGNIVDKTHRLTENEIKNINNFMQNIPYKLGKYAIRGDQDTHNFDLIMDNTNFSILDNKVLSIYNHSNEAINIVGININEKETITANENNYTITLINNYDNYDEYNIKSNLVLAGNNLGGEIKLFNHYLISNNKYMDNYYERNNAKVYISNGLGSPRHMRFMNHPSINVYRLFK